MLTKQFLNYFSKIPNVHQAFFELSFKDSQILMLTKHFKNYFSNIPNVNQTNFSYFQLRFPMFTRPIFHISAKIPNVNQTFTDFQLKAEISNIN